MSEPLQRDDALEVLSLVLADMSDVSDEHADDYLAEAEDFLQALDRRGVRLVRAAA